MNEKSHQLPLPNAVRYHLLFAWWSLLCFLTAGIGLESLHAFKIGWYLNEDYEIRRLMWTLGHAHGTLLSLVHAVFAVTVYFFPSVILGKGRMASPCFMGASILLPGGFFLGGIFVYGGDPGIGVWLVPLGAALFFLAVLLTGLGVVSAEAKVDESEPKQEPARKKRR